MKIKVKVLPNSSRNQIEMLAEDSYKVKLTAPAIEGKANQVLLKLLAKHFSVPKSRLKILKGEKGREKLLEITS